MKPILPLSDLPLGTKKRVVVDGQEICLYHLSDGIFATQNICSHKQASLADGEIVEDRLIECPRHGARFDIRTGNVKSLPAILPITKHNVKVENDMIYLDDAER